MERAGDNHESWPVAVKALFAALMSAGETDRQVAFDRTFNILGHLSHLIQDLAAPSHTRNDVHLGPLPPSAPSGSSLIDAMRKDRLHVWANHQDRLADISGGRFPSAWPGGVYDDCTFDGAAPVRFRCLMDTGMYLRERLPSVALSAGIAEFRKLRFKVRISGAEYHSPEDVPDRSPRLQAIVEYYSRGELRRAASLEKTDAPPGEEPGEEVEPGVRLTSEFQELVFDFSAAPIPTDATDIRLTVAYVSPEAVDGRVFVSTKRLKRPPPAHLLNHTDYWFLGWDSVVGPTFNMLVDDAFGDPSDPYVQMLRDLTVKTYERIAVKVFPVDGNALSAAFEAIDTGGDMDPLLGVMGFPAGAEIEQQATWAPDFKIDVLEAGQIARLFVLVDDEAPGFLGAFAQPELTTTGLGPAPTTCSNCTLWTPLIPYLLIPDYWNADGSFRYEGIGLQEPPLIPFRGAMIDVLSTVAEQQFSVISLVCSADLSPGSTFRWAAFPRPLTFAPVVGRDSP